MNEELTIIIPAYKCGPFLSASVESALYSPAIRVLIADDGSGPELLADAERIAATAPDRIEVLKAAKTRGTAANMNEAAEHVETPFFAKLDGDDVLLPGYLETVFPIIAARPRLAVLAGHELRIAEDEALEFRPELLPHVRRPVPPRIMAGAEAYSFIVNWNPNPCSSGVIYRTDAFREIGGYDCDIKWGEDWEIWLRFAQKWDVGYVDTSSALYRIHHQSATATGMRQNRLCFGYDAVFRRAAELCDDPEVMPLIRRRMFAVAKSYAAAAAREALRSRDESVRCWRQAWRALATAVGGINGVAASTLGRQRAVGYHQQLRRLG